MATVPLDPIATHGRTRGHALAAVDIASERQWTWEELDKAVNCAAQWLAHRLGAGSRARVATLARNSVDLLVLQRACARAGAIYVPLNWRLTSSELAILYADATPALLIYSEEFGAEGFGGEALSLSRLAELLAHSPPADMGPLQGLGADDPWTLLYTSGTTGRPKGVIVTQETAFWSATNFLHGNGVSSRSVFLCDMPLFHTAGLFAAAGTPLLAGATVLVSQGFDPVRTLQMIADRDWGVTHYFAVPQMAQGIWNQPGFSPDILSRLEVFATGGAPNPKVQVERFIKAGVPMSDGFGMTETGSNFGMPVGNPARAIAKAGSIGLPYLAVDAKIVGTDGETLGDHEIGELYVAGPGVTPGYWQLPERTAEAFDGAWFRTGDAAYRDADGFYFLVDRKKDMYISGGENVYPAEVEGVIAELDGIAQAAVVGVPDERWGEIGIAYVSVLADAQVTANQVASHCRQRLAKYKVPQLVVVTHDIPRTSSGKVLKHVLRERAEAEQRGRGH